MKTFWKCPYSYVDISYKLLAEQRGKFCPLPHAVATLLCFNHIFYADGIVLLSPSYSVKYMETVMELVQCKENCVYGFQT